eukprot:TRINITY_DN18799_c0_g2_i1.p1 TRINITY_DN18799_c0_g2~~TRINITY_DN18799_c0_g2_i1.p1  ORF type:complete len:258 (-),score=61.04 TRINITY_DN18799_c0_g2_i1:119-892(-)
MATGHHHFPGKVALLDKLHAVLGELALERGAVWDSYGHMLEMELPTLQDIVQRASTKADSDPKNGNAEQIVRMAANLLQLRQTLTKHDPALAEECGRLAREYLAQEERTEDERAVMRLVHSTAGFDMAKFRTDEQYRRQMLSSIAASNNYSVDGFLDLAERHGMDRAHVARLHIVWLLVTPVLDPTERKASAEAAVTDALTDPVEFERALRTQALAQISGTDHAAMALCYCLLAQAASDPSKAVSYTHLTLPTKRIV